MTIFNVSTSAELNTEMGNAVAGDTIILADGAYDIYYGATVASYGAGKLTLRAENKWGASIGSETFSGSNVIFEGIDFTGNTLVRGGGYEFIKSRLDYTNFRDSDDCVIKYCFIHNFVQLEQTGNNRALIECNLWREIDNVVDDDDTTDWLQIQGGTGHIIRRNTFWDRWINYVSGSSGSYTHTDHIQIMDEVGTVSNITIEDNWFYDSGVTQQQVSLWVIMLNCNAESMLVRGNIVCGVSPNGMFMRDKDGNGVITENLTIAAPQDGISGGCPITLKTGCSMNVTVTDNVVNALANTVGATTNVSGNTTGVSGSDMDWTNGGASISDYVPNDGGLADVDQRWRTRVNAMIARTEDFYDPDGTLYLAGMPTGIAILITGTLATA